LREKGGKNKEISLISGSGARGFRRKERLSCLCSVLGEEREGGKKKQKEE